MSAPRDDRGTGRDASARLELDIEVVVARLDGARRVLLVGTGTSEYAALIGASMLVSADVEARAFSSSEFRPAHPRIRTDGRWRRST